MTDADYRRALRLLNHALDLLNARRDPPQTLRRRLGALAIELHLLRARSGQAAATSQRN